MNGAMPGTTMRIDDHLDPLIHRALAEAQAAGKDHLTQTEEVVRAVL